MKTQALYLDDSYLKEIDAKIIFSEFTDMTVDRSVFYPTTYGQPNDTGKIIIDGKEYGIVDVIYDGEYIHLISLDTYPKDAAGKIVHQVINWDIRFTHMKFRSALRIISGIAFKKFGVPSRINETYDDRAWIDIEKDDMKDEEAKEIMDEANEIVKNNVEIKTKYISQDEYMNNEDLRKLGIHEDFGSDRVRLVGIGELPFQPDFGTHVKKTGEIGEIKYKTSKIKGKISNRITINF
ncbi:MAG: alanyl-tRNA editing protein [Thermoplasmata archaeon]